MAMKLKEMSKNPLISPKYLIPEFLPSCSVPLLRFWLEGAGRSGFQNPSTKPHQPRCQDTIQAMQKVAACQSTCAAPFVCGSMFWGYKDELGSYDLHSRIL